MLPRDGGEEGRSQVLALASEGVLFSRGSPRLIVASAMGGIASADAPAPPADRRPSWAPVGPRRAGGMTGAIAPIGTIGGRGGGIIIGGGIMGDGGACIIGDGGACIMGGGAATIMGCEGTMNMPTGCDGTMTTLSATGGAHGCPYCGEGCPYCGEGCPYCGEGCP